MSLDHGGAPRLSRLSRLSPHAVHLDQSCRLPRHSDDKPLRDGDIVNIDVTVIVDGWHGDTSRMYLVGDVKRKAARLVDITYESMMRGIAA